MNQRNIQDIRDYLDDLLFAQKDFSKYQKNKRTLLAYHHIARLWQLSLDVRHDGNLPHEDGWRELVNRVWLDVRPEGLEEPPSIAFKAEQIIDILPGIDDDDIYINISDESTALTDDIKLLIDKTIEALDDTLFYESNSKTINEE